MPHPRIAEAAHGLKVRKVIVTGPGDAPRGAFFTRLKAGLSKTRELLFMNVGAIARGIGPVDEGVLSDLEEAMNAGDKEKLLDYVEEKKLEEEERRLQRYREELTKNK